MAGGGEAGDGEYASEDWFARHVATTQNRDFLKGFIPNKYDDSQLPKDLADTPKTR